jgi:hypothetical protein
MTPPQGGGESVADTVYRIIHERTGLAVNGDTVPSKPRTENGLDMTYEAWLQTVEAILIALGRSTDGAGQIASDTHDAPLSDLIWHLE